METFPILWFFISTLLASGSTKGMIGRHPNHNPKECDPEGVTTNHDVIKQCDANQRCHDDDGDGHFYCDCQENYYIPNPDDGQCKPGFCPYAADPNGVYQTIIERCYYFERQVFDYVGAVANCKTKFNGLGRLFEPKNNEEKFHDTQVIQYAQKLNDINNIDEGYWIGIRTRVHAKTHGKSDFYYVGSFEALAYNGWSKGEPNDLFHNEDCVSVLNNNNIEWVDDPCTEKYLSICELDVDKEEDNFLCGKPEYNNDLYCDDDNNNAGCKWDGGACCNQLANPNAWEIYDWKLFCSACECKDPDFRKPFCKDLNPISKCKKCKGQKCKTNNGCKEKCKKTCKLCKEEKPKEKSVAPPWHLK